MPFLGTTGGGSVKQYGGQANLGYFIKNSLRLRSSASAYLNRTPATASNRKTWTWSAWVKRGTLSSGYPVLFQGGTTSSDTGSTAIAFASNDRIYVQGYSTNWIISNASYRDPSAWYHIVLAMDSTQATGTNRLKLYVNGSEVSYNTYNNLTQNTDYGINQSANHVLGQSIASFGGNYFDGYMGEINFVDGQQLTPSSFGKTDAATGQWIPKKFAGTYGTNGFYLKFADASAATAAAIGKDSSGNGNNWTPNNISVTAGSTYDAMIDAPTLSAVASNYAVLNILDGTNMGYITVSNANLTYSEAANANGWRAIRGTIGVTSGKYRFSVYGTIGFSSRMQLGLCTSASDLGGYFASQSIGVQYNPYDGTYYLNGSSTSYGSTQRITAVFDFIFDATTGKCWVAVNGTLLGGNPDAGTGEMTTFTTTSTVFPVTQAYGSSWDVNFGQRPWDYTIATASGFKSLNTFNL